MKYAYEPYYYRKLQNRLVGSALFRNRIKYVQWLQNIQILVSLSFILCKKEIFDKILWLILNETIETIGVVCL